MSKTLVIIPTYNEIENIELLISKISKISSDLSILIVDDASPDSTGDKVEKLRNPYRNLWLIRRAGKLGLGTAYIEGFMWGLRRDFDLFIGMDADFSHDPKEIPNFIEKATQYDFIIGSRYIREGKTVNWGIHRKLLSKGGNIFARTLLNLNINDLTSAYRLFRREVLERIDLEKIKSEGYAFNIEMAYRIASLGFRIGEIPITFTDRETGSSKMSRFIIMEAFIMVLKLFFEKIRSIFIRI